MIFTLLLSLSSPSYAADLANEPYCYDEDKVFKTCRDQREIFDAAVKSALSKQKLMIVIYGYEACPWSQSIVKVLNHSSAAAGLRAGAVIVPIVASKLGPSGRALMRELAQKFGQPEAIEGGVPKLVLFDPASDRGRMFSLQEFERNTPKTENAPAYYGYEAEKILKKISELAPTLKR